MGLIMRRERLKLRVPVLIGYELVARVLEYILDPYDTLLDALGIVHRF